MTGTELRQLRARAGWTWVQTAGALGVHWRTVARWEASAQLPPLAAVAVLATLRAALDGESPPLRVGTGYGEDGSP